MAEYNVTNPQPSGSPLNLLYKGVFSTRIGSNHKSKFGQYLDKLHHIKFLGIGTLDGAMLPGVVNALMVRHTSIDQQVETYKTTRENKMNESVTLEVLGGTVNKYGSLVFNNQLAQEVQVYHPAEFLKHCSGLPNSVISFMTWESTANQVGKSDTLLQTIFQDILRQTDIANFTVVERMNKIKNGHISVQEYMDRIQRTSIDALVEQVSSRISKSLFQTDLQEVVEILKSINEVSQVSIDLGNPAFKQINGVIDFLDSHGRMVETGVQLTKYKEHVKAVEEIHVDDEYVLSQRVQVKFASIILNKITSELSSKDGKLLIKANEEAFGSLIRQADLISQLAYLTERYAKQGLQQNLDSSSKNDKTLSILHYLLMKEDSFYRRDMEDTMAKFINYHGYSKKFALDIVNMLGNEILKQYSKGIEFSRAVNIMYGLQDSTSLLKPEQLKENIIKHVYESFGRYLKPNIQLSQEAHAVDNIQSHIGDFLEFTKADHFKGYTAVVEDYKVGTNYKEHSTIDDQISLATESNLSPVTETYTTGKSFESRIINIDTELNFRAIPVPVRAVIKEALKTFDKYLKGNHHHTGKLYDNAEKTKVEDGIILHTRYYDVMPSYKQAVDEALYSMQIIEGEGNAVAHFHQNLLQKVRQTSDYREIGHIISEKIPEQTETKMVDETIINVKKISKEVAVNRYQEKSDRIQKERQPAEIDFDHVIMNEDSKRLIAVLDTLHKGFESMVKEGSRLEPEKIVSGVEQMIEDALITDYLLSECSQSEALIEQNTPIARRIGSTEEGLIEDLYYIAEDFFGIGHIDMDINLASIEGNKGTSTESLIAQFVSNNIGFVMEEEITNNVTLCNIAIEEDNRAISYIAPSSIYVHEYESAKYIQNNNVEIQSSLIGISMDCLKTNTISDVRINRILVNPGSVMDYDQHGEMWNEQPTYSYDFEIDVSGELTSVDIPLMPQLSNELILGELTNSQQVLSQYIEPDTQGEITNSNSTLQVDFEIEHWGELVNLTKPLVPEFDNEVWGELYNESTNLQPEKNEDSWGELTLIDKAIVQDDYKIAVLGCTDPKLKYRRRPDLEPDKKPDDPLFEWICTEGYVCDDWLIVPLKDFNFEHPEINGFYDPLTFEPYFPTGQEDENGDPYVLPPYSILNEPLSNGVDVGGKFPMTIDPCNLYSFIQYIVKIYDAYKGRFHASTPIDTISRVMNMIFEQVQKLISEWDETKGYTPDELWRVYRFIRWMALGITNRFYRVKIEYTYGDFIERFEAYPFTPMLKTEGASRKTVSQYGWVLEGHPILPTLQNNASMKFKVPKKTKTSTISFELGNLLPNRPDELIQGGVLFKEDFEGVPDEYRLRGNGWVPVQTQSGSSLGIEDPARAMTYKTSMFNVSENAKNPFAHFNYGIETNMDTQLELKKSDGTVVWRSSGNTSYGLAKIDPIPKGDFYFEVKVPQSESNILQQITFSADQIQKEWKKAGYITEWKVVGDTIYEEENTDGYAIVVNEQWIQDNDYEFEFEFYTKEYSNLYWAYDWLGGVFNYKDPDNYYRIGTWSDLDGYNSGIEKIENGQRTKMWEFDDLFLWKFDTWHKMRIKVQGNRFQVWIDGKQYFNITDSSGWGYGASGLSAFSNPFSTFRQAKYKGKPRFNAFVDNVVLESPQMYVPVNKPKYLIDFYLGDENKPRIPDYLGAGKRAFSFPIVAGEHNVRWVFKKQGEERSTPQDASFIDNINIKGIKVVGAKVVEEFNSCGGHLAVKLLIENLLEYYRRHHQGCKGERNIWIIE
ncbi:hypothetical protein [Brevibacillus laterosporus]|uniref:hypothetical protein n=1 Tax=Brevibacillus laterosporus TaxID=1465 RepID=UPI003D1AB3F9